MDIFSNLVFSYNSYLMDSNWPHRAMDYYKGFFEEARIVSYKQERAKSSSLPALVLYSSTGSYYAKVCYL